MSGSLKQFATQEPSELVWFERVNYISVNIALIGYGMHIVAFCACAYYLLQEKDKKKNIKWLVFIFALFVCGTGNISFNMTFNEWAWIDFRAYPGGPLAFLLEQQPNVNNTWGNSFSLIVGLLTDSLLIYRVHVVYQMWWVIVIPILSEIAVAILGSLTIFQTTQPQSSLWANITLNFSIPYFSLAMATNILLTGMLVLRLLYMRHRIMRAMDRQHGRFYTNIVAMLLESAALYGVISLIFLVLYSIGNTAALLFLPLLVQVQCISPVLILLRVARGRAWTKETVTQPQLSQMAYGKPRAVNLNQSSTAMGSGDMHLSQLETFQASTNKSMMSSKGGDTIV